MTYLTNGFSLSMIEELPADVTMTEAELSTAKELAVTAVSAIDDADTARVASDMFGIEIPVSTDTVTMKRGDRALVIYNGDEVEMMIVKVD